MNKDEEYFYDFYENEENVLIHNISRQKFMDWMEKNGFNENRIKTLLSEKRICSNEQSNFNQLLVEAYKKGISMIEMILYLENLENSVFKIKKFLSLLDENTRYILKNELATKYKIKSDKNILYKIF